MDKKGEVLRNAIVWLDTRAEKESKEIAKNFPSDGKKKADYGKILKLASQVRPEAEG